tara:strand:+ start:15279 stop:16181 length:903 start_codon:yes stop_codon:yes gene_type:complete
MPAFCQHTRKPLKPLSSVFSQFASVSGAGDYSISDEGVIYSLKARSLDYGPEYFLEEYENQYGKSYLEDESNLRRMGERRLRWMESSLRTGKHVVPWDHPEGPLLLEIGSAAGFFLDEAAERGFRTAGIEVSDFAADFARNRGHKIFRQSFLSSNLLEDPTFKELTSESVDVLAAFYTLEHFSDQALAFRRISSLLKPGGLFLLAIPSYHGPVFRCDPSRWVDSHPQDHFADYSPDSLARILKFYGLDQIAVRPASFHRQRMCGWRRYLPDGFYRKWATKHAFGDTMEVLAIRDGASPLI